MTIHSRIKQEILASRTTQDIDTVKKLSTVLADIETPNLAIVKAGGEIPNDESIKVLRKFINNLSETRKFLMADEVGNHDLLLDLEFEIALLSKYLPREVKEDELTVMCEIAVDSSSASTVKDMGKAMAALKALATQDDVIYDGGVASKVIRNILLAA